MKAWLVGARGMLGSATARALDAARVSHCDTDVDVDITARGAVLAYAEEQRPTHIVNCAAYTAVDKAESEEVVATAVNGEGPRNLAKAAKQLGAVLVHLSTDYVFDGAATEPYRETDPTGPLGAYGRSKLAGEVAVQEELGMDSRFRGNDAELERCFRGNDAEVERRLRGNDGGAAHAYIVRTAWLFGPGGNNFVRTMARLCSERDTLRVVADQRGRPTYTRDLADALLRLAGITGPACPGGIYHFANRGETTWHALAEATRQALIERNGPVRCRAIEPITSADYPTPAKRPAYSVLATNKLEQATGIAPRSWRQALGDYVAHMLKHQEVA